MPSSYTDGETYDRISAPMERVGLEVLERLALRGDETVLDAGCGSGRVTQALLGRLAHGQVIGVDGSPSMIEAARRRLGETVELHVADLEQLDLGERRVDAVLSTAAFHWIADHSRLFTRLRAVMAPGARLVAQCGGQGNVAELIEAAREAGEREPFSASLGRWRGPWNFVSPPETDARLRRAGFEQIRTWLVQRPAPYEDLRAWLRTNALSAHLERLPQDLREPFLDAVQERLGPEPEIAYVRLNIDAVAG